MRLPSVKTIQERLMIEKHTAESVRAVMEEYRANDGRLCAENALARIDTLINGHGVEFIQSRQDTMRRFLGLDYVNMGDTYRCTVLFDHSTGRFDVACWGDYVEAYPRRFS